MTGNEVIESRIKYWGKHSEEFFNMLEDWLKENKLKLVLGHATVYNDYLTLGVSISPKDQTTLQEDLIKWFDDALRYGTYTNNLKQEIKKLGMTQKGFAEHIGVSQNSVSTWVRGETPIPEWLPKFIHYYKKSKLFDEIRENINNIK